MDLQRWLNSYEIRYLDQSIVLKNVCSVGPRACTPKCCVSPACAKSRLAGRRQGTQAWPYMLLENPSFSLVNGHKALHYRSFFPFFKALKCYVLFIFSVRFTNHACVPKRLCRLKDKHFSVQARFTSHDYFFSYNNFC